MSQETLIRRETACHPPDGEAGNLAHFLTVDAGAQAVYGEAFKTTVTGLTKAKPSGSNISQRKRPHESEVLRDEPDARESSKRRRRSVALGGTPDHRALDCAGADADSPIGHWARHGRWPEALSQQQDDDMSNPFARKKSATSATSSGKNQVDSVSAGTPSDQKPREMKSIPYANPVYAVMLEGKGSIMAESARGISPISKAVYRDLLGKEQSTPRDSLFRDDLFDSILQRLAGRNETMVVRDLTPLIIPSAQTLEIYGATHLTLLTEAVNEGWNMALPVYGPRPQPDYSVGFGRSAFTEDQLASLRPAPDQTLSYFMATVRMYMPFLTCEVKCTATDLEVADRQNAHSMTIAVRAVVELFKSVRRENEIDDEILAFSVSHDQTRVAIYGHYAELSAGREPRYYRHLILSYALTTQNKWTAYTFTKNVYDIWMPKHLERIRSAINDIPPGVIFDVSQPPESQFGRVSALPQGQRTQTLAQALAQSSVASVSAQMGPPSDLGSEAASPITLNTSMTEDRRPKKPRNG